MDILNEQTAPRSHWSLLTTLLLSAALGFASAARADGNPPVELPPPLDITAAETPPAATPIPAVPQAADASTSAIPAAVSAAAPPLEVMRFVTLGRVTFDSNKAELSDAAKHTLDQAADFLAANPGTARLLLDGHTDWVGGIKFNDKLSDKRALAVQAYLLGKDVAPSLIHWKGHGKRDPIDENWTRLGRDRNRQVEIYAVYLSPAGTASGEK